MADYRISDDILTSIADKIREKTESTENISPIEFADSVSKVYDAGRTDEYDEFWDSFQNKGKRTNYSSAFTYDGWRDETYNPKYTIYPTSCNQMFLGTLYITDTKVDIDLTNPNGNQKFYIFNNSSIVTIRKLIVNSKNSMSQFEGCTKLKNITIEGEIGTSPKFASSPLTVESMKSVITHLKNYTGTDSELKYTVTFTDACWEALEADSTAPDGGTWQNYVTNLGWNI